MPGCPLHNDEGRVFIVTPFDENRQMLEMEVLSSAPTWDLSEGNQVCRVANINGGDSGLWDGKEGL